MLLLSDSRNTWEPRSNLYPKSIKDYEPESGSYLHAWPHRCDICDLPCELQRDIRIHKVRSHKPKPPQSFKYTLTDSDVRHTKLKKQQETRPHVYCEDKNLDNVFSFKYLGSLFSPDGDQLNDIRVKITIVTTR